MQSRRFLAASLFVILILIFMLPVIGLNGLAEGVETNKLSTFLRVRDYSGEQELVIDLTYLNDKTIEHFWKEQKARE